MLIVRAGVKFALTKQPGEEHAAIDGDGKTIYKMSFFEGKVPAEWLHVIHKVLMDDHDVGDSGWAHDGYDTIVKGVYALDFHVWVRGLVKAVDPTYSDDSGKYSGGGFRDSTPRRHGSCVLQARAIRDGLAKWVAKEPRVFAKHVKRQRTA